MKIKPKAQISNFRHNSVGFRFNNGNSIDAIFGGGTYSDNYDNLDLETFTTFMKSTTVESMYNCGKKLAKKIEKKFGEQPLNRISIDDWLEIAILVKREKLK